MPTDPAGSVGRGLTLFLMGSGGDGVITAGDLLARAAAHDGLSCRLTKSFGPQIRGGESAVWLQLDTRPVRAPAEAADVVLVFSWRSLPQFRAELRFADPDETVVVKRGDHLVIPAHRRHRVEWTDPHGPTVWLALHYAAQRRAGSSK